MSEEIMEKFKMNMRLETCFNSISEISTAAYEYMIGEYEINDVEELIVALECIPGYVKEIEQIVLEIADNYENEIRELRNEQL